MVSLPWVTSREFGPESSQSDLQMLVSPDIEILRTGFTTIFPCFVDAGDCVSSSRVHWIVRSVSADEEAGSSAQQAFDSCFVRVSLKEG